MSGVPRVGTVCNRDALERLRPGPPYSRCGGSSGSEVWARRLVRRRRGPRPLGVVDEPGSLDPIAALFYTLCGEVPTLPTLTISWRTSYDPFLRRNDPDQTAFTIHVAIPDVQARDVAAIYAWKRAEIFSVESDEERSGQGSLRGSPWAERLVFFVESQPQGGRRRWSEIHKAFAKKYPEQPYRSPESMKVAYYRRCRQRPRVAELSMMLDE